MRYRASLAAAAFLLSIPLCARAADDAATAPATRPADALELYERAAAKIVVASPASSSLEYPESPPFGPAWDALARDAWEKNAEARRLARLAVAAPARWPTEPLRGLSQIRAVANELGDAAIYRALANDPVASLGLLNDLFAISDQLRPTAATTGDGPSSRLLVGIGIEALTANRLMLCAPDLAAAKGLPDGALRALIVRLLDLPDAQSLIVRADIRTYLIAAEDGGFVRAQPERARVTIDRVRAELNMASVVLAANQFRAANGRWPTTLDELVPTYLPTVPRDPANNGPLGYVVAKGGLPDGGDRPLVYSREEANGPLAYLTDGPQYGFYVGDGSNRPIREQRLAGQFRDLARWSPAGPVVRDETARLRTIP